MVETDLTIPVSIRAMYVRSHMVKFLPLALGFAPHIEHTAFRYGVRRFSTKRDPSMK